MNKKITVNLSNIFRVFGLILLGIIIGIAFIRLADKFQAPKQLVTVVGTGEVDAITDQATINVSISSTGDTAEAAREKNSGESAALKNGLLELGIPESRITQSSFTNPYIKRPPVYEYSPDDLGIISPEGTKPVTGKFTASTNLTIVLDSLNEIERVFDVINASENAVVQNTYYSVGDRTDWETKAKGIALEDARSQIESVAAINHLKVGKLKSLYANGGPVPFRYDGTATAPAPATANGSDFKMPQSEETITGDSLSSDIFYSEQTVKISASYTAVYELY